MLGRRAAAATLKKAGRAIFEQKQSGPAAGFLQPIDTDRMARTLRLDEVATENGQKNLPPSEGQTLDAVEQSIVQPIEAEWTLHGGELINHLRAYAQRLIGFSIDAEFQRLHLKANDALTNLRAAHVRAEAELGNLLPDYLSARREYEGFRTRHRLTRSVRNQGGRWTAFGLLFVLVALESVLNGFFFAKGSEFGLVGGVGTAIGISLCNVAVAFALGLGPSRWINHRNLLAKLIGVIFVLIGMASLVALHAFAGHFRDATALVGEERAMAVALEHLQRAPWILAELSSYYLFGLGVLFALLGLWKGYTFDDPYPAYGSHARRAETANQLYAEEHRSLFDDLEAIKDATIKELENSISHIPMYPQQAAHIRAQRAAMLETFRAYEAALEAAANQLLTRYRDKNRQARTTPAPAHFSASWKLPRSFLTSAQVKELTAEAPQEAHNTAGALDELRRLSKEVLGEFEGLMTKFPHATPMHEQP